MMRMKKAVMAACGPAWLVGAMDSAAVSMNDHGASRKEEMQEHISDDPKAGKKEASDDGKLVPKGWDGLYSNIKEEMHSDEGEYEVSVKVETDGGNATNDNGDGNSDDNDEVPQSGKDCKVWRDLQARIQKGKVEEPSRRPHFCSVCGFVCSRKERVGRHAQVKHKSTHPNFSLNDALPLNDVEQYYHFISKLENPCSRGKNFTKMVNNPAPKPTKQKPVPPSVKNMKCWMDLKAKIDKGKDNKIQVKRPHFCPVCGRVCSQKQNVLRHAQDNRKTHPDFLLQEALPLDNVEKYYHFIKSLENPCKKAKYFIRTVNNPVATANKPKLLPRSVKKLKTWIDLQAKIDNGKESKASVRIHFCPVCGLDCCEKSSVLRHVKRQHKKGSHPEFSGDEILLLDDVKSYYFYIKKLKKDDLHEKPRRFRKSVKSEIRRQKRKRKSSNAKDHEKSMNTKKKRKKRKTTQTKLNKRKRYHPRQAPGDVVCGSRFKRQKNVPLGCENTSASIPEVKLEDDVRVKTESSNDSNDTSPFSSQKKNVKASVEATMDQK